MTSLRGWFEEDNRGNIIVGTFEIHRNEVKIAVVEKTYEDEIYKNTGKIVGTYNEHFSEFKSDTE